MIAQKLIQSSYSPYGDVICAREDATLTTANLGTAQRFNHLANLQNLRLQAKANLSLYRCHPMIKPGENIFSCRLLERHLYSTQVFVPMSEALSYLVIVCGGRDKPDLSTLRAFVASGAQGITYHAGTWHHPLIVIDKPGDFACVVWEDGSADDCEVVDLEQVVRIDFRL